MAATTKAIMAILYLKEEIKTLNNIIDNVRTLTIELPQSETKDKILKELNDAKKVSKDSSK